VIERSAPGPVGRGPEGSSAAAGIVGAQLEGLHGDGPLSRLCLLSRDRYAAWALSIGDRSGRDVELRPTGVTCVALDEAAALRLRAATAWQERAGCRVAAATRNGGDCALARCWLEFVSTSARVMRARRRLDAAGRVSYLACLQRENPEGRGARL
jgi:hypothetical protein